MDKLFMKFIRNNEVYTWDYEGIYYLNKDTNTMDVLEWK